MANTDWLKDSIINGMQGLLALRLESAPAVDTIQATALVWLKVFESRNIAWDESADRERIRDAFRTLAAICKRWPSPADFFENLPKRKQALKLTPPVSTEMPKEIRYQLDKFLKKSSSA